MYTPSIRNSWVGIARVLAHYLRINTRDTQLMGPSLMALIAPIEAKKTSELAFLCPWEHRHVRAKLSYILDVWFGFRYPWPVFSYTWLTQEWYLNHGFDFTWGKSIWGNGDEFHTISCSDKSQWGSCTSPSIFNRGIPWRDEPFP